MKFEKCIHTDCICPIVHNFELCSSLFVDLSFSECDLLRYAVNYFVSNDSSISSLDARVQINKLLSVLECT
jgi:hypothetical protein